MNLETLISFKNSNPFVNWPNYTKAAFIKNELNSILNDKKYEKAFEYYYNNELVCYFQLQYQDWDSNHFGFKCGKINYFHINETLVKEQIIEIADTIKKELLFFLESENYRFIFIDVNSSLYNSNFLIQYLGFNFIVNWTDGFYKTTSSNDNISQEYNLIKEEEVNEIATISKKFYYKGGRFYLDKTFNPLLVDEMYASIIRNSFKNNDVILIASNTDKPIGAFISRVPIIYPQFNNIKVAHLRFLVLDENYRGMQIGYNLFKSVLNYFNDKCDLIVTGLESHNHTSLNLHNKFNFKYNYSHNAYHLWLK